MRHQHAQFSSPIQLPALIKASRQSVDRIPATACPLCHRDTILRDLNTHTPSDDTLVVTLEQFRRHLGADMEQLALFALPRGYKDEGENADSNAAAAMAHSDSPSRCLSETDAMSLGDVARLEANEAIHDAGMTMVDVHPWSKQPLEMRCLDEILSTEEAYVSDLYDKRAVEPH